MLTTARRLLVILAVLAVAAAGCGGSEPATEESPAATPPEATTSPAAQAGGPEQYCNTVLEIEQRVAAGPDIDFERAGPEEQAEAAKQFAASLLPLVEQAQAAAPTAVREDVDVLVGAVENVAETGDFGVFETPEVEAAGRNAHAFELDNCGWQRVDVTATEYAFEGVPATSEGGPTSFEFDNDGAELHEMVLLRKRDGVTESFEELLQLPQEEAMSKVEFAGVAFAAPGEQDGVNYVVTDLQPGEYAMVCFIPVGTTSEESFGDGPPHFTQGMLAEFTVG